MTKRQKYDFDRLDKYCKENNVTLLQDYLQQSLNRDSIIDGKCVYENCNNTFEKIFYELEKRGAYCKSCLTNIANEKRKITCLEKYGVENSSQSNEVKNNIISKKFNFNLLQEYCNKNNVYLNENYENIKLHAHYLIKGKCTSNNCYNVFIKKFHKLINTNALCKKCIVIVSKEKRKETNLKILGCENYFQNENIKNKIKESFLLKYGVEHPSQNKEIQNKIKATCLIKYGVLHHSYNKDVQNKIKQTNIMKYGIEHLMKNPDYLENMLKKSHKFKDYILPSGNIIKIQGYENLALNELIINENINESDIITGAKNVPTIWYNDENNKERIHFVDIFIPSQNRCIEVKSTWTFMKEGVLCKQKAAKELGYKYEIWVYDKKGNKICYD
jgi:hypothetical protein